MKLLIENAEDIQLITEKADDGSKKLFIEGIFMQADVKNRNGRVYPKSVMENEVNRYIKERVEDRRAWGELNHPKEPNINLERVCHRITELKMEGSDVIGKALVITEHPMGKILQALLESGGNVGVSSRGLGSIKKNSSGIMEVQNDFHIVTAADAVSDPSANAFVTGIMENTEYFFDAASGTWMESKVEQIKESFSKMNSRQREESQLRIFRYFLDGLTKK